MKKHWLYLVILILILPISYATITVDGPSKDSYNIGDKLDIKSTIIETIQTQGLLKLELNCETTSPLFMKTISLEPNKIFTLQENLPIPSFLTGTCSITASIESNSIVLDQSQSKSFIISNQLIGNIQIDKTEAQLGEKITLTGKITKQDNSLLEGIANIFFKTQDNIVLMESLTITKGILNYIFDTTSKPSGTYIIETDASDIYGNKYINNELTFNLIDQLVLELQSDKTELLPESSFNIKGTVKDIKNNPVKEGKVIISLDDQVYITEINKGSFTQKITTSKTIKSGPHTIHVSIKDNYGNLAEKDTSFTIIPLPTVLELKTSEESIKPESVFKITAFVYDQAADKLNEKTKIEITNPKKDKVLEKEVLTEEEVSVEIPQSASPGLWMITGYSAGLKTKKQITVEEVSSINIEINAQELKITNTGNIKYKEPIQITFKNQETEISEAIKPGFFGIKPTAFAVYNLGKYIKTGTYDVLVNQQEFKDIPINQTKSWFSIFYLIPVAIIIILLIFLFASKNLKSKTKIDKERQKGKYLAEKIRAEKPPMTEEQLKEKYKKEFIGHMLKQVEARDQEVKKQLKFDFSSKKEPPSTFVSVKLPRTEKSSIISTIQKSNREEKQPLWRVLRKKGLDKKEEVKKEFETPKKPGIFSMFD